MRTVLCFGDSNTWGADPASGLRFPREVRWPGRLQLALGDEWHVVEEGLPGRTATLDSPLAAGKNGLTYLVPCLDSHAPLDVVVIALGTNDLADRYGLTPTDVARAAGRLVTEVRRWAAGIDERAPAVLLVCPPRVGNTDWDEGWQSAAAKSALLPARFHTVAEELAVEVVDLSTVTQFSDLDGIHLDADAHDAVAAAIEGALRRLSL